VVRATGNEWSRDRDVAVGHVNFTIGMSSSFSRLRRDFVTRAVHLYDVAGVKFTRPVLSYIKVVARRWPINFGGGVSGLKADAASLRCGRLDG
jgi:hypothetical protein